MRSLLPIIIIISILATSVIIPADVYARYEIKKEETFGEPGNDPTLAPEPLTNNESLDITDATSDLYSPKKEEVSGLRIFTRLLIEQIAFLFF